MTPQRRFVQDSTPTAATVSGATDVSGPAAGTRFARAVTTAAIPAVVLSSMALAQPAQATTTVTATSRMPGAVPQSLMGQAPLGQAPLGQAPAVRAASVAPETQLAGRVPAAVQPAATKSGQRYTVKKGDTINSIASRHDVSVGDLLRRNHLGPHTLIFPGQVIKLTGGSDSPRKSGSSSAPAPRSGGGEYTVKKGDTISSIAADHAITTAKLLRLNDLGWDSLIRPGQTIRLNESAGTGHVSVQSSSTTSLDSKDNSGHDSGNDSGAGKYTIKSGDTLTGIAADHGVSVAKLAAANKMSRTEAIYTGRTLTIPGDSDRDAPKNLVPSTFLHYTYPDDVVANANKNKAALLASPAPSTTQMQQIIRDTAQQMGVEQSLALAFAYQESGFNHRAVSPANAIGTMQVIPTSGDWASQLVGRELNLLDPQDNVVAGLAIIRSLQRTTDSQKKAIGSYYQGQASVEKHGLFKDTKAYVASVQALQKQFD